MGRHCRRGTHTVSVYATDFPANTQALLGSGSFTVRPGEPFISLCNGTQLINGQQAAIDFGDQLVGGNGPIRTFTVKNIGDLPLSLSNLMAPSGFVINENLAATLAAGDSDTFTIKLVTTNKGACRPAT